MFGKTPGNPGRKQMRSRLHGLLLINLLIFKSLGRKLMNIMSVRNCLPEEAPLGFKAVFFPVTYHFFLQFRRHIVFKPRYFMTVESRN